MQRGTRISVPDVDFGFRRRCEDGVDDCRPAEARRVVQRRALVLVAGAEDGGEGGYELADVVFRVLGVRGV